MKTDPTLYDIAKQLVITTNAFEAKREGLKILPTEMWPKWAKTDLEATIDALWHAWQIGQANALGDAREHFSEKHAAVIRRGFNRRPEISLRRR